MYLKDALDILEIDVSQQVTLTFVNKRYRKLALQHHPDKNGNTHASNERFQRLNEAYQCVKSDLCLCDADDDDAEPEEAKTSAMYIDVLTRFVQSVMEGRYSNVLAGVVADILHKGQCLSHQLAEELDKDMALNIYIFLSRYKSILYISDDLLEQVRQLVVQKHEHVEIYKLNPSITDLMNHHFYKLYVRDQLYLVPLWHHETYYDGSGCEIIAICEPDLPSHISIDEDNNLRVDVDMSANLMLHEEQLSVQIGDDCVGIPLAELRMMREQWYRIRGRGLVNIKKDLYDLTDKTDLIVKIRVL